MKLPLVFILLPAAAFLVGAAGCARSRGDPATQAEPPPAAVYKPGHGVQLSPPARAFVGLVTAEVEQPALGGADQGIALPMGALLRTARGDFVYVVNGDWLLRTPVTVGIANGATVQITDGLYEGDTIVVQGVRALALAEMQALNGGVGCADGH